MFDCTYYAGFAVLVLLTASIGGISAQEDDMQELVSGNTDFTCKLYQSLRQAEEGNLFFSPYSVSQALAMTYAGAGGTTAQQIADTLSFTLPQLTLHEAFNTLNADLVTRGNGEATVEPARTLGFASSLSDMKQTFLSDPAKLETVRQYLGCTLRIANSLWGERSLPFNPAYIEKVRQHYGGGLQLADFINAPDEARQHINAWVADETNERIQNIVPEGVINSATRLVLTNAIYFKNS
jgi:serpin B